MALRTDLKDLPWEPSKPRRDEANPGDAPGARPETKGPENPSGEDLFVHCRQRMSKGGRIAVSKKAWAFRAVFLAWFLAFLGYNVSIALSAHDPLIVYYLVVAAHSVLILIFGWIIFKNRATGGVPDSLVSVIIPVYNQEKLIEKVVKAVCNSTYSNIEVIAVDDGSKDGSAAVLEAMAPEHPRLSVVHKPNGGKRTAVAEGFKAARGNFIALIDSDSIIDKYALEELMKVFSANPRVGGVVGNAKVLNADKNILTRCQDVWYDNSFNIVKTAESTFGTVLCLSGCLSAYRREAIERFIPYWAAEKIQDSDDRSLTIYTMATRWAKSKFAPLERRLMESAAGYDDAEDRALTSQALKEWHTVYAPTAVVYTEVPERFLQYIRQQIRWRKGYVRTNFFASAFLWRKHPIMAFLFYSEFMSAFVLPVIFFSVFFYRPFFMDSYWFLSIFVIGQLLIGLAFGLDYKFRDGTTRNWIYKPLMNLISVGILWWILIPALWSYRKKAWLTR